MTSTMMASTLSDDAASAEDSTVVSSNVSGSTLEVSTDIVKALFGASVGRCYGDFFCTFSRIRGRLYASSTSVLFYNNLLGFEKRICLPYTEIDAMELCRTTSIRISMLDGEEYIFRSFVDREKVLHVLKGLKIMEDRKQRRPLRPRSENSGLRTDQTTVESSAASVSTSSKASPQRSVSSSVLWPATSPPTLALHSSLTLPPSPMVYNRRRSVSDSLVRTLSQEEEDRSSLLEESSEPPPEDDEESVESSGDEEGPAPETVSEAWAKAKSWSCLPSNAKIGIECLPLNLSLDRFHDLFLADHAEYSLDWYQRTRIGDRDIEITPWQAVGETEWTRTMVFCHPIKNSMGMGPSSAKTTRQQRLRRFLDLGMELENTTVVEGIPSADAFHVQDHWLIEAEGDGLRLETRYGARFTKRALFRGIIEKNINKETQEWFLGYAKMVQDVLEVAKVEPAAKPVVRALPAPVEALLERITHSIDRATLLGASILVVLAMSMVMQYLLMRETLAILRDDVNGLRGEVSLLLRLLEHGHLDMDD